MENTTETPSDLIVELMPPRLTHVTIHESIPDGQSEPHFLLTGMYLRPTAGFSFHVDSVETDVQAGRIIAKITSVGPDEALPESPTPTALTIFLGRPEPGRHLVELHIRKVGQDEHILKQAFVIRSHAGPTNLVNRGRVGDTDDED